MFIPSKELAMRTRISTTEAQPEIETRPVNTEAKMSK